MCTHTWADGDAVAIAVGRESHNQRIIDRLLRKAAVMPGIPRSGSRLRLANFLPAYMMHLL